MSNKILAVCTYATKDYLYAWNQCIQQICSAVSHYETGHFIYAGDDSKECKNALEFAKSNLPENWKIHFIAHRLKEDYGEKYKKESQLLIARLQQSAFTKARQIKADLCLSVEADVLISPDSLRVLEWSLMMPSANGESMYDIAAGTYPNSGPLLGFGTPEHHIAEDFLPSERILPPKLKLIFENCEKRIKDFDKISNQKQVDKEYKRLSRLHKRIKNCPPDGNIWEVIAKHGWRRRGWLDNAMPACLAFIFQSDWCGLGVTLMSKKALALADFNGYEGEGTQDLFLNWKKWYPAGLKILGVPHIYCDHVKRRGDGKFEHLIAYRETDGEYKGHMRVHSQEWIPL